MIEQLTDEERRHLQGASYTPEAKALRIIDAHAADRAALVAQLDAAQSTCACSHPDEPGEHGTAVCQIDDAPEPHVCDWFGRFTCRVCGRHRDGYAESDRAALVAQVAELTRERDDWKAHCMASDELGSGFQERVVKAESEVARLTEALAAAEQRRVQAIRACDERESALQAAEARVHELEAQLGTSDTIPRI